MTIINILILLVRGTSSYVRMSQSYRRQILKTVPALKIIAHGPGATWARVKGQVSQTVFPEKKVCQNLVPVTFIPTAHARQSLVAKVSKSSDRSIHQGANIQVLRQALFVLSHIN